jgi:heparan-alpha-glucosaminide N-acetyltransferase
MPEPTAEKAATRLLSLDAYRGFTMLAMASAGLGIPKIARQEIFNDSLLWDKLAYQFDHVVWRGCSFWDLIQPSFMFIVGVAMPFSFAAREVKGQRWLRQFGHAVLRSVLLVCLSIFLMSQWDKQPHFEFTNVLAQIGLGYAFVFLLLGRPAWVQALAALAILVADWGLFARFPLPGPDFSWYSVGVPQGWDHLQGFAAHWDKNVNFASAFDQWFLNLFPRPGGKPFVFSEGGYATLNFVPSMATMIFGVLAGELLRSRILQSEKISILLVAGALGIAVGSLLDATVCPVVKRIWTPSWAIYSAGWTSLELAVFYWICDVRGYRKWAFPLVVVGMNSIAMYVMSQLMKPWVTVTLKTHLGQDIFAGTYGPLYQSLAVLFVLWLICFWLYRRRIFFKI